MTYARYPLDTQYDAEAAELRSARLPQPWEECQPAPDAADLSELAALEEGLAEAEVMLARAYANDDVGEIAVWRKIVGDYMRDIAGFRVDMEGTL